MGCNVRSPPSNPTAWLKLPSRVSANRWSCKCKCFNLKIQMFQSAIMEVEDSLHWSSSCSHMLCLVGQFGVGTVRWHVNLNNRIPGGGPVGWGLGAPTFEPDQEFGKGKGGEEGTGTARGGFDICDMYLYLCSYLGKQQGRLIGHWCAFCYHGV